MRRTREYQLRLGVAGFTGLAKKADAAQRAAPGLAQDRLSLQTAERGQSAVEVLGDPA
jgi:hypothetical protein